MSHVLTIIAAVLGAFMALLILLQHRSSGLSATFGGAGTSYVQRRGAEKFLFTATVWTAGAFLVISTLLMYI